MAYRLVPYLWVPSLDGDVPGRGGSRVDVDLIGVEDLEIGFMMAFEAAPTASAWSLAVDSLYVRFDQEKPQRKTQVDASMLEAVLIRRGASLEPLVGVRVWDFSSTWIWRA